MGRSPGGGGLGTPSGTGKCVGPYPGPDPGLCRRRTVGDCPGVPPPREAPYSGCLGDCPGGGVPIPHPGTMWLIIVTHISHTSQRGWGATSNVCPHRNCIHICMWRPACATIFLRSSPHFLCSLQWQQHAKAYPLWGIRIILTVFDASPVVLYRKNGSMS